MRYEGFSFPEGRTYSPPDYIGRWYPLWGRMTSGGRQFCADRSGTETVRSARQLWLLREPYGQCYISAELSSLSMQLADAVQMPCLEELFLAYHNFLPTACINLPLHKVRPTGAAALLQRWVLSPIPICFFKKATKTKTKGR